MVTLLVVGQLRLIITTITVFYILVALCCPCLVTLLSILAHATVGEYIHFVPLPLLAQACPLVTDYVLPATEDSLVRAAGDASLQHSLPHERQLRLHLLELEPPVRSSV
jgi:hypothetical protein